MNDIFPKLMHAQYITLIDAHTGYHYLKLDKVFMLNHTYMSNGQIHVCKIAIWSHPSRTHVPEDR